jgi:hypothetical protein
MCGINHLSKKKILRGHDPALLTIMILRRRGGKKTQRHGDMETWRHGDMETRRQGDRKCFLFKLFLPGP